MNEIYIGELASPRFHFIDSEIISGNAYLVNSPISDTIEEDVLQVNVKSDAAGNRRIYTKFLEWYKTKYDEGYVVGEQNILEYQYGTPVYFKHDGALVGKFFLSDVEQVNANVFTITAVSSVGLLSYKTHYGGVYGVEGTITVADLIRDIVGDVVFVIDPIFETMLIQGYLPKDTARKNLQQVLFATGAAILKTEDGEAFITFNQPDTAHEIAVSETYIGGNNFRVPKATAVTLVEHQYFKGSGTPYQDVFNNLSDIITVDHQEIVFRDPMYDLRAYDANGNDITSTFIIESHENYAIIGTSDVGRARVAGKPYLHQQRQLRRLTGVSSVENREVNFTNATLVSPLNSTNCLNRIIAYYTEANEVEASFVFDDEKTGELVQLPDIYRRIRTQIGYIKDLDINISKNLKAVSKISTDWRPRFLGNTYNRYLIIDKNTLGGLNGTWNVPQELRGKEAYIVMFSGASGGYGGQNGANGGDAGLGSMVMYDYTASDPYDQYITYNSGAAGAGGLGGLGGLGGEGCKRYGAAIITLGDSYSVALGVGGEGGAVASRGSEGGHTTFGNFTSDENDLAGVYVNFVDNSVYCIQGENGANGGSGGAGGTATALAIAPPVVNSGKNGETVKSFVGGQSTDGVSTMQQNADRSKTWYLNAGGGGGGGASANAKGGDATNPSRIYSDGTQQGSRVWWFYSRSGGNGGDGADATQPAQTTDYGRGGRGSDGGGGGGGAGACARMNKPSFVDIDDFAPQAVGGKGGKSAKGGQGADGFVLVYYTEEA